MKRLLLAFLLIAAIITPASVQAQGSQIGACAYQAGALTSAYKEMLTVSSTAKILTVATYAPTGRPRAVCAVVVVSTNSISWWANGEVPTAASGIISASGVSISIGAVDMPKFQMIRVSSDAEVAVLYFVPVS